MSIRGSFKDLALSEIFQFIEQTNKSGLLSFRSLPVSQSSKSRVHYIWVDQGRFVAAANRLDHQGLVRLIEARHWVSEGVIDKLVHWCCPPDKPLGLYLQNQGILQTEQLQQLFNIQILQQMCALFQLKDGIFQFDLKVPIPAQELTGFTVPATEAMLMGLRMLPCWDALADKLPSPNESLVSIVGKHSYRLDPLEWQVWEYANGTVPLFAIAQQLNLSQEQVQQIAFRLSAVGLTTVERTYKPQQTSFI